ncbi:hypothetical protein CSUI_006915, partial [Cystoisospora suis]
LDSSMIDGFLDQEGCRYQGHEGEANRYASSASRHPHGISTHLHHRHRSSSRQQ